MVHCSLVQIVLLSRECGLDEDPLSSDLNDITDMLPCFPYRHRTNPFYRLADLQQCIPWSLRLIRQRQTIILVDLYLDRTRRSRGKVPSYNGHFAVAMRQTKLSKLGKGHTAF